jgi:osmotically-inducible protein OsmY
MASISGNVQTTVDQGVVTLRGTAPSENAMDELALRISKLPGVVRLNNQLSVSNR